MHRSIGPKAKQAVLWIWAVGATVALVAPAASAATTAFKLNTLANAVTAPTGAHGSITGNLFTLTHDGTGAGAPLSLVNNSSANGATGLKIKVASGHAPLSVNSATKVANLNADALDGLDSTALQQVVTGTCSGGKTISTVYPDGDVQCRSPVEAFRLDEVAGNTNSVLVGGIEIDNVCHNGATRLVIAGVNDSATTLNWFYSDGSATYASGGFINGTSLPFDFGGKRIEGQFIARADSYIQTINVHMYDAGSFCEATMTIEAGESPF